MGLGKTLQAIGLILSNRTKAADAFKTTLILCPVSVMSNWTQQIEEHIQPETLKVAVYHGTDRGDLLSNLDGIDVLISSYGTISTEFGNEFPRQSTEKKYVHKTKKAKKCISIFQQKFHRIILDEAHTIRNIKSRAFRGCCSLQATYRLCMTGTPLQNKPDDIHSLFSFLAVEPLDDKNVFRRAVTQPILNGDDVGLARLRTVMAHVALRRNKSKLNLKMANKVVEIRSVEFPADGPHKRIHDILFKSAQTVVQATLGAGDDKAIKNYMMILETLTRIRQACVSGELIPKERLEAAELVLAEVGKKGQLSPEEGEVLLKKLKGAFDDAEAAECAVCLDEMEEGEAVILKSCAHVFCEPCLSKISAECGGLCPLCRKRFTSTDMVKKSIASAAVSADNASTLRHINDLGPSPKLEALLQAITEMKADEKGVIFSQFKKFLDLVGPFMTTHGFTFVRIDGSKTAAQRISAVKEFAADGGPRFILCSLHAAGTGITLHRANHCFMMDPWWNGSIEDQAMDRVHRIGQNRDVRVIRFVMKDSIEGRMIALQEAKAAMGKGAMEKLKPEEFRKARIGDLKSLFSIREN
jgi:SWI/SNF-related matrix-associated actin-dependent regulator of chromatin subfamily A3